MGDEAVNVESALENFLAEDPTLDDDAVVEEPTDQPDEDEPDDASDTPDDGASDEDSGEDDDAGESEDDESEGTTSAVSDDTLVDITIGGEEYEVNFAELKAGYLRNEEFANKVQEHEDAYSKKLIELEVREAELAEELRVASVVMAGDLSRYDQINWQALKEQDPERYKTLRLEAIDAKEKADQVINRRRGIEAMHQKAQELRHKAYVAQQVELAGKLIPDFKEPAFFTALVKHAKDLGYSEEDVKGIADARHLLLLNNSRLYAEGVVKRKEAMEKRPVQKLPPVVTTGQPQTKSSVDRKVVKQASERLRSEKSVDAAAAYLMTLDL